MIPEMKQPIWSWILGWGIICCQSRKRPRTEISQTQGRFTGFGCSAEEPLRNHWRVARVLRFTTFPKAKPFQCAYLTETLHVYIQCVPEGGTIPTYDKHGLFVCYKIEHCYLLKNSLRNKAPPPCFVIITEHGKPSKNYAAGHCSHADGSRS